MERDTTYLKEITMESYKRLTLENHDYSTGVGWFYGVGLKKLLATKFLGHSLGMVAEVKRLNNKSGTKKFKLPGQNRQQGAVTTTAKTRCDGWILNVSAVINF